MKKTLACLLLFCAVFQTQAKEHKFYDSYPGTLTVENDQLILNKCSDNHKFVLVDFDGENTVARVKQLMPTFKMPVSTRVSGDYYDINGVDALKVDMFMFFTQESSCHLLDFIDSVVEQHKKDELH